MKRISRFFCLRLKIVIPGLVVLILGYGNGYAQLNSVVLFEFTNTLGDDKGNNANNQGDNPFSNVRAKLFLNSWINDNLGVFMKFLFDEDISVDAYDKFRIDGAYFLYNHNEQLNVKAGMIPVSLGNFPERNYFERNSLIGSPLVYSYKTSLSYKKVLTDEEFFERRGVKGKGTNLVYEACWPTGVEVSGEKGLINYKFVLAEQSLANPESDTNSGLQYTGRLGLNPVTGMKLGAGYSRAPYLPSGYPQNIPSGSEIEDYEQQIISADFEYTISHIELYAEWFNLTYDIGPRIEEVSVNTYYVEGKYKITPRLYAAGRFGQVLFDDYTFSNGITDTWDVNISRVEFGLGLKVTRKTTIKGVAQLNYYPESSLDDVKFVALQFKTEL